MSFKPASAKLLHLIGSSSLLQLTSEELEGPRFPLIFNLLRNGSKTSLCIAGIVNSHGCLMVVECKVDHACRAWKIKCSLSWPPFCFSRRLGDGNAMVHQQNVQSDLNFGQLGLDDLQLLLQVCNGPMLLHLVSKDVLQHNVRSGLWRLTHLNVATKSKWQFQWQCKNPVKKPENNQCKIPVKKTDLTGVPAWQALQLLLHHDVSVNHGDAFKPSQHRVNGSLPYPPLKLKMSHIKTWISFSTRNDMSRCITDMVWNSSNIFIYISACIRAPDVTMHMVILDAII